MVNSMVEQSVNISHLGDAVGWIEQVVFGSLGVTIAVLGVGLMGFRILLGYANPKEMGRILLGCFILFGAPTIARGLIASLGYGQASEPRDVPTVAAPVAPTSVPSVPHMPPANANPFDPYSNGASTK
jgi:type IV secretory pathway VirB2 component (pilin)